MLVPVESKQIAFCSYNEDEASLYLYYHTGDVAIFSSIGKTDYQTVIDSPNRYDTLMSLMKKCQSEEQLHSMFPGYEQK
ncbi:hypothetical protein [Paenibacillus sacheonensis]|uniref:KTSC domain-containing protein n=1 Tax=Paenibacillus sacheonensis TaxID=742054 RepID=A0A7X5C4W9_9BACL|nr:hypothetical protein [Paenibacillus sacheonensis]MBM7567294.1 hypothetical protein [Paenibacillus sacheonensis]NBC72814.1 hypothetical protein [Paenibacillus sacheonensis]